MVNNLKTHAKYFVSGKRTRKTCEYDYAPFNLDEQLPQNIQTGDRKVPCWSFGAGATFMVSGSACRTVRTPTSIKEAHMAQMVSFN
ncbi:hypothetical protein E2C01_081794 [Portunus trituberculatus]|uniref:Uncharacterized protein n=1 Tax=Portunus trituberculatus TaxID=210409 RepID=A0A5B7IQQ1_PORTR|nr:hypothetical protein [Portunus trituberculatus]